MLAWEKYKWNAASGTSVANLLISKCKLQIRNNRHNIAAVAQSILFCGHQEIALRGHNESSRCLNRGNLLELMEYQSEYDPTVKQKLKDGPNNARNTSPEVQNSTPAIMANLSVLISGKYTLVADECRDVAKQEQMSVALRYVDFSKLLDTLNKYELQPQYGITRV
uniref:DUF4371 domain-containing protein n=1 Tax=Amphimedon queenslandica TaxID=400682 RepID=A0A1X7UFQ5_AMPQE